MFPIFYDMVLKVWPADHLWYSSVSQVLRDGKETVPNLCRRENFFTYKFKLLVSDKKIVGLQVIFRNFSSRKFVPGRKTLRTSEF